MALCCDPWHSAFAGTGLMSRIERYAGAGDGWLPDSEWLPDVVAERRLRLRQAVRGDQWKYRLIVDPLDLSFS